MDDERHTFGSIQESLGSLELKNNLDSSRVAPYTDIQQQIISIFTHNIIDHKFSLHGKKLSHDKYFSKLWLHSVFSQLLCLTLHEVFEPHIHSIDININTHTQIPSPSLQQSTIHAYQSSTTFYDNNPIHLLSSIRIYKNKPLYLEYKSLFKQTLVQSLIDHLHSSTCIIPGFPNTIYITRSFQFTRNKGQYIDIDISSLSLNIENTLHKPRDITRHTTTSNIILNNYAKTLRDRYNRTLLAPSNPFPVTHSDTSLLSRELAKEKATVVELNNKIDMMITHIQQKDKNIERLEEVIVTKQNSIDILNDRVKKLEDMFNSRLLPPLLQADQVSITNYSLFQPTYISPSYRQDNEVMVSNLGDITPPSLTAGGESLPLSFPDPDSCSRLSMVTVHSTTLPSTPVHSPELSLNVSGSNSLSSGNQPPLTEGPNQPRVIGKVVGDVVGS